MPLIKICDRNLNILGKRETAIEVRSLVHLRPNSSISVQVYTTTADLEGQGELIRFYCVSYSDRPINPEVVVWKSAQHCESYVMDLLAEELLREMEVSHDS